MKANRFAAELLLPEEAITREIQDYLRLKNINKDELDFGDYAAMIIFLTVRYQIPLKEVIYRFYEEQHIRGIDEFIENMERAFSTGNASEENILEDAAKLGMDMNVIRDFLTEDEDIDDDDEELFSIINAKRE